MKTKMFDCVKMKEECQRACEQAYGGLPLEERRRKMRADILADDSFGRIFRRFFAADKVKGTTKPKVAEAGAEYRAQEPAP